MAQQILYFGSNSAGSTSAHRVSALQYLGVGVVVVNVDEVFTNFSRPRLWFEYRTGYRFMQNKVLKYLTLRLRGASVQPTAIWINSGELFGPLILQWLRNQYQCSIILYCNDDPTGSRDKNRFISLRAALPYYDLCVCVRAINELEWLALGARKVLRVWMSYDEIIHYSTNSPSSKIARLLFVGNNIPAEQRDEFLFNLLLAEVPLTIYGTRWHRSWYWSILRNSVHQGHFYDSQYSALIAGNYLNLGLLSHGNRDLHTTRSLETPAALGVLFAERTSEHQLLYEDGVEALFWSDFDECARVAKQMLKCSGKIDRIRRAAHPKVGEVGVGNQDICRQILASI